MSPHQPPPTLSYAIGDIHGRADLLDLALDLIARHRAGRPGRIVSLGDLVDRGPDSRGVVERLMALTAAGEAVCLKGNHEEMMLDALLGHEPTDMMRWLDNGGVETLESYGGGREAVPAAHLDWLAALPLVTRDAYRVFVHAGLAPKTPLERQDPRLMLWIREPFLRARPESFDVHVVHGHTPRWAGKPDMGRPELLEHRTNLDTGAFATGRLTIGVFDAAVSGGPVELLVAEGPPGKR